MIAIMIPIKPYWFAKILNGEKGIEVRKNKALAKGIQKLIDKQGYAPILGYCTKEEGLVYTDALDGNGGYIDYKYYVTSKVEEKRHEYQGSGKVVARFRCDKLEEIYIRYGEGWVCGNLRRNEIEKETCLSRYELYDYLKNNRSRGYAIHISQLKIFDKPKEINEFKHCTEKTCIYGKCHKYMHCLKSLTKAPQNFCYVEVEE